MSQRSIPLDEEEGIDIKVEEDDFTEELEEDEDARQGSRLRAAIDDNNTLGLRMRWCYTRVAGVLSIIVFSIHLSTIILLSITTPLYDEDIAITVDDDDVEAEEDSDVPLSHSHGEDGCHNLCTRGLWYVYRIMLAFPNFLIVCSHSYGRAHKAWCLSVLYTINYKGL